ncbi:MAG TPA: DegT/DnrJ/EryC1/StrS family aminotransferase [Symbiobacteriaceae bacterium]
MVKLYDFRPTPEDAAAVLAAMADGEWADGPRTRAFEAAFAAAAGAGTAIAAANGTAALQAICAACLAPGAEVLTTPFTFIATANAICGAGAIPRFADVDPATGNLDSEAVQEALRAYPRVRALMLVHLYGRPCDMGAFTRLAAERGLTLLEDCAQAAGAAWNGHSVGTFGRAGAFSFYATKNLATGEGGMVTTDDPDLAAAVRRFINHGRGDAAYHHVSVGYNFRMHGLAAALGLNRLPHLSAGNAARRSHAAAYQAALADLDWLTLPADEPGHVYHQYVVRTPHRDRLKAHLAARGVESAVYYPDVLYRQPAYRGCGAAACPEAERLAREVLALPVRPGLTAAEQAQVIDAVRSFQ